MLKQAVKILISCFLLVFIVSSVLIGCRDKNNPIISDEDDYTPSRTVTSTKIVTYDGPSIMESSGIVDIKVNDIDLFVYETLVNHKRLFTFTAPETKAPVAIFDFEGSVDVKITIKNQTELTSAVVRPLEYNIQPQINGNVISFTLQYSGNYVIEYNSDSKTSIHLFANPLETDTPDPDNIPDDMLYIGPGVYKANAIPVTNNMTVYIAGGAIVYGSIRADHIENLTIRGRGIIDGSIFPRTTDSEYTLPIEIRNSKNITIEGLTFLNPAGWAITSYFCEDVNINNIKIITARGNGDGISIQSSKKVNVKGGFVRTWDDSLVVKNRDRGVTSDILFDGITVWTDLAQSMEIGYETNGEYIKNVTFKNITVLHNFHKPAMSIHNCDDALISNILFQNITIEDAQMAGDNTNLEDDDFLIEMTIAFHSVWTKSGGKRGIIKDIIFDNIKVLNALPSLTINLSGYDKTHNIDNITFNNVLVESTPIKDSKSAKLSQNQYVSSVKYAYDQNKITGAKLRLPYILKLNGDLPLITQKQNIIQDGFIVPEFATSKAPIPYVGQQVLGDFTVSSTRGEGTTINASYDDGTGQYHTAENPVSNGIDGDRNTVWKSSDWEDKKNNQFIAYTVNFDSSKFVGNIRLFGEPDSNLSVTQKISVFAKPANKTFFDRLLYSADYEFSPSNNNYTDIKIPAGNYDAIQLRIFITKQNGFAAVPYFAEIEFYPPSLTFNKAVSADSHEDVYNPQNMVDGNNLTYYESSKGVFPASITIDMAQNYNIKYINLHLPPLMSWEPRTQNIEIMISTDGKNYTSLLPAADYLFDPKTGNMIQIELENSALARYIKLVYNSNSSIGGWGAQLSEIYVFE
ncbi:MAG TPA: discoidin domain-containing protein [Clostridia bacterium]